MKNIEQEYSFKVTNIKPFLTFCKENGYNKIEKTEQTRILYKKNDKTMLRLTIKKKGRKLIKEMDFKQDKLTNESFVERKESLPIIYSDDAAVQSIIEFLGYEKNIELKRQRYVYSKEDIKFEIDEYISPDPMLVVGIEGNLEKTKLIYEELKQKLGKYFSRDK